MLVRCQALLLRWRLPHLVQHALGLALHALGHLVQNVGRLVHPTTLLATFRERLAQCRPKTQCPVADGQLRSFLHAPILQIQQHFAPRNLALAIPVTDGKQFFLSLRVGPHDRQDAALLFVQANVDMNPVDPHVHVLLALQIPPTPFLVLLLPLGFQPNDVRGRQSRGIRTQDRSQGLRHVAATDSFQVQDRDQSVHAGNASRVPGKNLAAESPLVALLQHLIIQPRLTDHYCSDPGDKIPGRHVTVAHHLVYTLCIDLVLVLFDKLCDLHLQSLGKQPPSSFSGQLLQDAPRQLLLQWEAGRLILWFLHERTPFVCSSWSVSIEGYALFFSLSTTFGYISILGARKHYPLPGRIFRHGTAFDFMQSFTDFEPTDAEWKSFMKIIWQEAEHSRML